MNRRFILTPKIKKDIIKEFNRTELKPNEKIIDNTCSTIAKIVGVKTTIVSSVLEEYLDNKINNIIYANRLISNREKKYDS
jgi:hypothetical protein